MGLRNVAILSGLIGLTSSCAVSRLEPDNDASWLGTYVRKDGKYLLHLKSENPASDRTLFAYWTPSGGSPTDSGARLTLFRIRGGLAFSTHIRHALEDDCPMEMIHDGGAIQVMDRCTSNEDFSGVYSLDRRAVNHRKNDSLSFHSLSTKLR